MDFKSWTNTNIFIVPTLKIKKEDLDENNFVSAFCSDLNKEAHENCAFLLFKPKNIDRFKLFVDSERERTPSLIDDYDYEGGYVVLIYILDKKFLKDFELIKQGKYSKTSDKFQQLFPKKKELFVDGKHRDEISLQWRIFKKTNDLKLRWEEDLGIEFKEDMEVWDGWNEKKETLDIENYK